MKCHQSWIKTSKNNVHSAKLIISEKKVSKIFPRTNKQKHSRCQYIKRKKEKKAGKKEQEKK